MTISDMLPMLFAIQADIKKQIDATPKAHPNYRKARKQIINAHKNLKRIYE